MNQKRLYIGLLAASLLVMAGLLLALWYVFRHQDNVINQVIVIAILACVIFLFLLLSAGIVAMVAIIIRAQNIPSLEGSIRIATTLLFPVAVTIGTLLGIPKEKIWGSYIEVNNYLVRTHPVITEAGRVMILAPHCLQDSDCPHKVTVDAGNCRHCGKCDISELLDLAGKYGAVVKIATGGTLARKYIKEIRPAAVVAVACERDLSLGIQDSNPLPVIGVLNSRPFGPCHNTRVDLNRVEEAIRLVTEGKNQPAIGWQKKSYG